MDIVKPATAGTLESSDVQITLEPADSFHIDIQSNVLNQYGRQIKQTVEEILQQHHITRVRVQVIDKGALDCTIRARTECAVFRALGSAAYPWEEDAQ